jgi:hypothetical protein
MTMQLSVVISSDGRVIAATKHHQGKHGSGMRPARDGHTFHQIELPSHLEAERLEAIVGQIEIGADRHPRFKGVP